MSAAMINCRRRSAAIGAFISTLMAASCAAPALKLYMMSVEPPVPDTSLRGIAPVIEVVRIRLPDYLDSREIVVRRGALLESSHFGRWAERLSLGATDLVTQSLAARRPDALVTDQPETGVPAYRIIINIRRLDLTSDGIATLDADWLVIPASQATAALSARRQFQAYGSTKTDSGVVALETKILQDLSAALPIETLTTPPHAEAPPQPARREPS